MSVMTRPSDERIRATLVLLAGKPLPPRRTDPRFKDLKGQTFGMWRVISYAGRIGESHAWHCLCLDCMGIFRVYGGNLKRGVSSCCRSCAMRRRWQKRV